MLPPLVGGSGKGVDGLLRPLDRRLEGLQQFQLQFVAFPKVGIEDTGNLVEVSANGGQFTGAMAQYPQFL